MSAERRFVASASWTARTDGRSIVGADDHVEHVRHRSAHMIGWFLDRRTADRRLYQASEARIDHELRGL
ncbi:MAG: hypothetical protein HC809_02065 [Gammaproteobacteria bacterium]|nr:hypothetical protein [Gammaproteobacteria bacterium]